MMPNAGIVGGTVLRIPAIQSPNFSKATKTGWEILQAGQAYFFQNVVSGEFDGTNFVINSSGAFFYNGTPAPGNLLIAIAPTFGTDPFGNFYQGGLSATQDFLISGQVLGTISTDIVLQSAASGGAIVLQTSDASGNITTLTVGPNGVTFNNGPGMNMGTPTATALAGSPTVAGTEIFDAVLGTYAFTGLPTHRYRAICDGLAVESTVANDLILVKIRDGGTIAPTIASPLIAQSAMTAGVINRGYSIPLAGTLTSATGVHTLGVFTVRGGGTGIETPVALKRELYVVDLGLA
jgi:hypothetical protein